MQKIKFKFYEMVGLCCFADYSPRSNCCYADYAVSLTIVHETTFQDLEKKIVRETAVISRTIARETTKTRNGFR